MELVVSPIKTFSCSILELFLSIINSFKYSSEIYQDEYEGFNIIYNDGLYSFDESNNVDTYKYIENEYLNDN